MSLAGLLVTVAVVVVLWKLGGALGAFVSGALAWIIVGFVCLSLIVRVPVPTSAVVAAMLLWATSQVFSRVKHGEWRSQLLRSLTSGAQGRRRVR